MTGACEATLSGGAGGFLYAHRVPIEAEPNQAPELVWLDPQTGERRASFVLAEQAGAAPQLGPLVAHQDRLDVGSSADALGQIVLLLDQQAGHLGAHSPTPEQGDLDGRRGARHGINSIGCGPRERRLIGSTRLASRASDCRAEDDS